MRLVSFRTAPDRQPQAGLQVEGTVLPVVGMMRLARSDLGIAVPPQLAGMRGVPMELVLSFWRHAEPALAAAEQAMREDDEARVDSGMPLAEVELTSPVTDPPSVRDFYAFEDHVAASWERRGQPVPKAWYEVPVFYFTNPGVLHGPDQPVAKPAATEALDFELEVGWVVGQHASDLSPEAAMDAVVGLTLMNDWSARDIQAHEMSVGLGPSKGKDFATSLGPAIVTLDELEDAREGASFDLEMVARIDGEEVSRGNLADLHWSIGEMTAHASRDSVIRPGDVMGTGTVGSGSILDLGTEAWLQPGQTVELEVERLGTLANAVVEKA